MRRDIAAAWMLFVAGWVTFVAVFLPWLDYGGEFTTKAWDEMDGPVIQLGALIVLLVTVQVSRRRNLHVPWLRSINWDGDAKLWWAWLASALVTYLGTAGLIDIIKGPGLGRVGIGLWAIVTAQATTWLGLVLLGRSSPSEASRADSVT